MNWLNVGYTKHHILESIYLSFIQNVQRLTINKIIYIDNNMNEYLL